MRPSRSPALVLTFALALAPALAPSLARAQAPAPAFGPRDGAGLPPADTGRVSVGTHAPDWVLPSRDGVPVTLSQFRGKKNIILVFYRGHW